MLHLPQSQEGWGTLLSPAGFTRHLAFSISPISRVSVLALISPRSGSLAFTGLSQDPAREGSFSHVFGDIIRPFYCTSNAFLAGAPSLFNFEGLQKEELKSIGKHKEKQLSSSTDVTVEQKRKFCLIATVATKLLPTLKQSKKHMLQSGTSLSRGGEGQEGARRSFNLDNLNAIIIILGRASTALRQL